MLRWISTRLSRKLTAALVLGAAAASMAFLGLFLSFQSRELAANQERAAARLGGLLQAALENAMLKRDLPGLADIVNRLGNEPGVAAVTILAPNGQVRFASRPDLVGLQRNEDLAGLCLKAGCKAPATSHHWRVADANGASLLRTVRPVANKKPCGQCHGPLEVNPVNGVLVVDFDASDIDRQMRASTALLTIAGTLVIALLAFIAWIAARRTVLQPVQALAEAARDWAAGRMDRRVQLAGADELARLGGHFNEMAVRLGDAMDKLAEHDAFLQQLIDGSPDAMLVLDEDYRIVAANRAYCEMVGVTLAEALGTPCHRTSRGLDAPCPPSLVTCPWAEIRRTGQPVRCMLTLTRRDGSPVNTEIYAAPLSLPDGRRMIVESLRNMEERVKFSQEQRLSAVGLLANGVAHEIHNPLASIRLALQATLRGMRHGTMQRAELTDYLELVDSEIDRCVAVTRRLLKLSAPPGERLQLVDLDPAVEETLSLLREEAQARRVALNHAREPSVRVWADDAELRSAVLNLTQNAFHAMPGGGALDITVRREDDEVQLSFADSGAGIPPDDLPHIFDPFFSHRADGSPGTGLGLAICKTVMERFGGRISVTTALGRGSTFTLHLRAASAGEPTPPVAEPTT